MTRRAHLMTLDGMRGVAALAVLAFHVSYLYRLAWRPEHGPLAVDFFFGLSGFVIAHAYDEPFAAGRMDLRSFFIKRIVRLYPLILLGTAIGGVAAVLSATHGAPQPLSRIAFLTVSAALLVPTGILFQTHAFFVNQPLWSLFYEAIANAIYGVNGSNKRFGVPAPMLLTAAALLLIVVALHYRTIADLGFEHSYWFIGGLARLAFPFLTGVMICRSKIYLRAPAVPDYVLVALLAAVLFGPSSRFDMVYDLVALIVVFPIIIGCGVRARSQSATNRLWHVLGALSYPLYAIHAPVIQLVSKVYNHTRFLTPLSAAAASVAIAIGAAWAALILYDQPLRAHLSRQQLPRKVARALS